MKKFLVTLLATVLLLSVVGCNKLPPDNPDTTDKSEEQNNDDKQLLNPDNYDEFLTDIYLCDDVYRTDDTPTHGSGSISLPMAQEVLELIDYDILLCTDACTPESVVSRASQGYAPVYRVVPDGEIDGNFKVLKFKMEIPEPMLEDIKKQGVYEKIVDEIETQYYYLLVLDEMHYAYIHLERIDGVEKIENEAELADGIVKNARISFKPKKLDPIEHSYTSDVENFIPDDASSKPEVTVLTTGKMILTYETDDKLPLVYFGQVVDAESVRVTKTEFSAPDFDYTAYEVIDYLYESGNIMYATVRFTLPDGTQNDILYSGYMGEYTHKEDYKYEYKWRNIRTEPANEINRARGQYDPAQQAELIPNQNAQVLFWLKTQSICYYFCTIRTLNSAGNAYTDDPPKDFAIYYQQYDQNYFSVIDEPIPQEYPYDSIVPILAITGEECISMHCILQLTDGDSTYFISYRTYPGIDQVYHPVSDDEAKILASIYPDIFGEISEENQMTEYTEIDEQTGYELSFVIPESWNHNEGDILGGVLTDENGKKRIGERVFRGGLSIDEWKMELSEMGTDLSKPFIGQTDSGLSYIGYSFKSGMQLGYMFERYLYRLEITEDLSLTIGIWDYSDLGISELDSMEFYNEYVLPILHSVTIRETGDDVDTISDIADWDKLSWSESWDRLDRKPASNAYNFIYNLVSGESEIPEYNGLGIKDYSITLVEDEGSGNGTTLSFTFTVTGNSLPETLPPGTYSWIIHDGIDLFVYREGKPTNQEEYTAYENRIHGLDRFGDNPAARAVNTYLSWMPLTYEVSPYGEWDMTNPYLPYNYICAYYGKSLEIGFSELQSLMAEKFGIAVERPEEGALPDRWLNRCAYDKARDIVYYADTRGYEPVHRIIGVSEEDGVTEVTVQLFADRLYLIPSHKVVFRIGEGEVFLGSEIVEKGNYEPREFR